MVHSACISRKSRFPVARQWNFDCFSHAIERGASPIVVDRGNDLNLETKRCARYAVGHGYNVPLKEPDSSWWQCIRVLLMHKGLTEPAMDEWVRKLAQKSRAVHHVSEKKIRRCMSKWRPDVTGEMIMALEETPADSHTG